VNKIIQAKHSGESVADRLRGAISGRDARNTAEQTSEIAAAIAKRKMSAGQVAAMAMVVQDDEKKATAAAEASAEDNLKAVCAGLAGLSKLAECCDAGCAFFGQRCLTPSQLDGLQGDDACAASASAEMALTEGTLGEAVGLEDAAGELIPQNAIPQAPPLPGAKVVSTVEADMDAAPPEKAADCVQWSARDSPACIASPECTAHNLKKAEAKQKCRDAGCGWNNSDKQCDSLE